MTTAERQGFNPSCKATVGMLSGPPAAGRINPVERNRGPETVDAMGILSSLTPSANGDTAGEDACAVRQQP
jgi:hypothetical protein